MVSKDGAGNFPGDRRCYISPCQPEYQKTPRVSKASPVPVPTPTNALGDPLNCFGDVHPARSPVAHARGVADSRLKKAPRTAAPATGRPSGATTTPWISTVAPASRRSSPSDGIASSKSSFRFEGWPFRVAGQTKRQCSAQPVPELLKRFGVG